MLMLNDDYTHPDEISLGINKDLFNGIWYLAKKITVYTDGNLRAEHYKDFMVDVGPDECLSYGRDSIPFRCFYIRKSTVYVYYTELNEDGSLCYNRFDAYRIDRLTEDSMRLRHLLSTDYASGVNYSVLLLRRDKPSDASLPYKRRWTRRSIPLLERADDLESFIGRSLAEEWGPMQVDGIIVV